MTPNADYGALRELIELCRDGRFYEDYDQSTDVLRRADEALKALSPNDGSGIVVGEPDPLIVERFDLPPIDGSDTRALIRARMDEIPLRIADLARLSRLSSRTVSRFLDGTEVSQHTVRAISKALFGDARLLARYDPATDPPRE